VVVSLFCTAQFLSYAGHIGPFAVISETLVLASSELASFSIALCFMILGVSFAGHFLFGSITESYASLGASFATSFDILMNPWGQNSVDFEDYVGGWLFYFFINSLLFLGLVQLLIAIICNAFDSARDDVSEWRRRASLPSGWVFCRRQSPLWEAFVNLRRPFNRTCGLESKRLRDLLHAVPDDAVMLTVHQVARRLYRTADDGDEVVTASALSGETRSRSASKEEFELEVGVPDQSGWSN
jgi:hypothetical protein